MNCREAQHLISAERDGALPEGRRASLQAHIGSCAECRQLRGTLEVSIEAWRRADAAVAVPDGERMWHDVRRTIRGGVGARGARNSPWFRRPSVWGGIPLGAAAAMALALWLGRPAATDGIDDAPAVAWAEYVEVDDANSTPMVYVDQESGWLVVWAVEPSADQS